MKKAALLLFFCILGTSGIQAQNLKILDFHTKKDITGDTITLKDTSEYYGWRSLNIEIRVLNAGSKAILTGARKREYNKFKPISHSFCFGVNCFDDRTFVSPLQDTIYPGKTDSTFSGHLIYDYKSDKMGIYKAAYVFYDVNNPADSAILYVTFNTYSKVGIAGEKKNNPNIIIYPNPVADKIFLTGITGKCKFYLTDISGKCVMQREVNETDAVNGLPVDGLPCGLYFVRLLGEGININSKIHLVR